SKAVEANALHHRSDAFSSIGTLVGVAGAMFFGEKLRILDPLAAITVSLFIIKSGRDIAKPCLDELLEASLPEQTEQKILEIVKSADGILDVHRLRTRRIGNDIAIDLHAKMDGSQTLSEAHDKVSIAEQLLKKEFGPGTIVNIHEEPWKGVPEEKGE
ncbi:MAG: cation diffusion facilitator family transporter, partial [Muribaculaceae bacterium]|nr:cation diffusion facilitator family transporter [Muribaculaceae bacterium]